MRNVSFRLDERLVEELDAIADDNGISRNAVLEVALYESVEKWDKDGGMPKDGILKVLRDKKNRTREGLLKAIKSRSQ